MNSFSLKQEFEKLNLTDRRELLEELLMLQELDGLVLQEATEDLKKQRDIVRVLKA